MSNTYGRTRSRQTFAPGRAPACRLVSWWLYKASLITRKKYHWIQKHYLFPRLTDARGDWDLDGDLQNVSETKKKVSLYGLTQIGSTHTMKINILGNIR